MAEAKFTHIDPDGNAKMVDVGQKQRTNRTAIARAVVSVQPSTMQQIKTDQIKKGNVISVAQLAGIMAAKQTSTLIPLCHTIQLDQVDVKINLDEVENHLIIRARVNAFEKTGVEMEALTAVSIAALTVYDMIKAVEKGAIIKEICLEKKMGGKSGDYTRDA